MSGAKLRRQLPKPPKIHRSPDSFMNSKIADTYRLNKEERDDHIDQIESKRSTIQNLKNEKSGLLSSGEPGQALTPQNDASIRGPEIDAEIKQLKREIPSHKKRAKELNRLMRNVEQLHPDIPEESRQARTSLIGTHSYRKSPGEPLRTIKGGKRHKKRAHKKRTHKKRTHKKRAHKKRTHKKRTHKKRTHKKRTHKKRHTRKNRRRR